MLRSERSQSTYWSTDDADSAEGFGKMSYRDRLRLRDRILSTHSSLREGACNDGGGDDDDDIVRRRTFFHTSLRTDPATFDFIGEEGKFIGEDDDDEARDDNDTPSAPLPSPGPDPPPHATSPSCGDIKPQSRRRRTSSSSDGSCGSSTPRASTTHPRKSLACVM